MIEYLSNQTRFKERSVSSLVFEQVGLLFGSFPSFGFDRRTFLLNLG